VKTKTREEEQQIIIMSTLDQGRRTIQSSGPLMETGGDEDGDGEGGSKLIGGTSFVARTRNPSWLQDRGRVYEIIKARRQQERETKKFVPITVTMPDGTVLSHYKPKKAAKAAAAPNNDNENDNKESAAAVVVAAAVVEEPEPFQAWKTTPYEVAATISQGLADASTVARVTYARYVDDYSPAEDGMEAADTLAEAMDEMEIEDNNENTGAGAGDGDENENDKKQGTLPPLLWDLTRPLVGPVSHLEFLKFDTDHEAKTVFWHSSAHMMGEALEHLYGVKLTIGPPLKGGFYYDSYMGTEDAIKDEDYKDIQKEVTKITKQKQKFERMVVTKEEALELFADNPFKVKILSTKVADNTRTTVYKCGDLIDLCRGPHVTHTGKVKAFAPAKHSAAYWLGDAEHDSLQRLYGISFPDKKQLKVWQDMMEKAKERDHRRVAAKQELIMFHELSPGSAFWLPHGTRIYNTLLQFIQKQYWQRGYDEIITPNIFNMALWEQSGHAKHYRDDMFTFDVEGSEWAMKPMNCPAHCLMFGHSIRSYRDLPIRYADFGVLHRNELSGALTGLTRVRRFQQDDAHIFCRHDQITQEVLGALNFMKYVYDIFGMTYKLELSTRPKKALGEVSVWNSAEASLEEAMNTFAGKNNWRVNPGDGAFYGPKIDIKVMDAMDRVHQCATVQLDFQLPIRFDLKYTTDSKEEGKQFTRPIIVHRAMLGSVERMFAVLCEHWGGKWPFWISPRQIMVIPVHADYYDYADSVRQQLHAAGLYADVDVGKNKFPKKVRTAQVAQYNFQLIVGKAEMDNGTANIRTRDNQVEGEMKVPELIAKFQALRDEYK